MKWTLLKWWYRWQIAKTVQGDMYLDQLYHYEKRQNAKALQSLHAKLDNLNHERMREALGRVPL